MSKTPPSTIDTTYSATPSALSGERLYSVTATHLLDEPAAGGPVERLALEDVAQVRLKIVGGDGYCTVQTQKGAKVVISSLSYEGMSGTTIRWVHQSDAYGAFVEALHERLAEQAPNARYVAGSDAHFVFAILAIVAGIAAILAAFFLNLQGSQRFGLVVASLFVIALGVSRLFRGRARSYQPDTPPLDQLPPLIQ